MSTPSIPKHLLLPISIVCLIQSGSLFAAGETPGIPVVAAPAPQLSASTSGPLTPVLQPFIDTHVAAGLVVLVADKQKVLDVEALGDASPKNKTPMATDDLFWIASMSKPITATAFMMLVDEGKASIDDPVEKYLPEFKGQMVVDENDKTHTPQPARHPITIKEIFSHTSGMIPLKAFTKAQFDARDDQDLQREVADYGHAPLKRQPGAKYEYNNAGINTAGRIIEVLSGMPYAEFMQKRIFDPLGMKDTTFFPTQEQALRMAHCSKLSPDKKDWVENDFYSGNKAGIDGLALRIIGSTNIVPTALIADRGHGTIFNYKYRYAMPAGGIYSTADDLAKFCQMLLNGGVWQGRRYLSESAIKTMTTVQTGNISPNPNYGLGWDIKPEAAGVPGAGTFAHTGAMRTRMWVDPTNGLVMILLMERNDLPPKDQDALYTTFLKASIQKYGKTVTPDRAGLRCVSSKPFPLAGSDTTPVAGADFETGKLPTGWTQGNGGVVTAPDAPQGNACFRMKAIKGSGLRSPVVSAQSDRPYFLSFWIKAAHDPWTIISFTSDERETSFTPVHTPFAYPDFPLDTGGQWKQEGYHLKISFTGNQIDLLGHSTARGGSVKVLVDGVPGDQAPFFITNFIQPKRGAWRIPHLAGLGPHLVPQTWTITMTKW
jgi:CubicO group peptidase (beta-lactamase class C family)